MARYVKDYVVEASIRKLIYNSWSAKSLKGYNRTVRCLYRMKGIVRGYRIVATRRTKKYTLEVKFKITRALRTKIPCNQCNKKMYTCKMFGIKVPNINGEALMMNKTNNNTLWEDYITKEMSAL